MAVIVVVDSLQRKSTSKSFIRLVEQNFFCRVEKSVPMSNSLSPTQPKDLCPDEESIIDLTYRFDWSKTSLGDMSTWPFSLKNAVVCNEYVKQISTSKLMIFYTKGCDATLRTCHVHSLWA